MLANKQRLADLTDKLLSGTITADEAAELQQSELGGATDAQKSKIFDLLEELEASLDDYTNTDWPDLSVNEASDIIDKLIGDAMVARLLWDEV